MGAWKDMPLRRASIPTEASRASSHASFGSLVRRQSFSQNWSPVLW